MLAHLTEEEDITFLLKVLYYWEEMYPRFTSKQPKTVEQYKAFKEKQALKEQNKS